MKRLLSSLGGRRRVTPKTLLTGVLGGVLLIGILGLGVIVVTPVELTEPYTEFYLLNTDGQAGPYPTDLRVGETGTVVVGIENHEHREMTFTVVVLTKHGVHEERTINVRDDARWRGEFSYAFELRGQRTLVFALYRGGSSDLGRQPYRRVYLYVSVQ